MIEVTQNPIDPHSVYERLSREGSGSILVNVGVVKPQVEGKPTKGIQLTPEGNIAGELRSIEEDLRKNWDVSDVLLVRRMGDLPVGEIILVAAVSAPGREAAFGACREAIERLKSMKCFRKKELYE